MMTESQKNKATEEETESNAKKQSDNKSKAKKTVSTKNSPKPEATVVAPTQSKRGAGLISIIALILVIGVSMAGYNLSQQLSHEQTNLTNRLSETEKTVARFESSIAGAESSSASGLTLSQSLESSNKQLQSHLQTLETKVDDGLNKLEQNDKHLSESLTTINDKAREKKAGNWLVAEARHLITIANHQSRLNHNTTTASAALEAADQRLRDAADPSLISVRQIITDDIIALRNVAAVDITGIALKLSQLEPQVGNLPLANEIASQISTDTSSAPASATEVSDIESFASKVWADVKGLVSVRRNTGPQETALLPPGQRFFLQQNLRLKLETARLALLQRDTQTFQSSLATASQWIERYFDTSDPSTANLLTTLSPYQGMELMPQLPDISNALRAIDEWQQQQQSTNNSALTVDNGEHIS